MKKLRAWCKHCGYKFNPAKSKVFIGTKFFIFDYPYIICPRCWKHLTIPCEYYDFFNIEKEEDDDFFYDD